MIDPGFKGGVGIVTGTNQGIGAAAARALADQGVFVFLAYLRLGPDDPGVQATGLASYAIARAQTGESVAEAIKGAGGRAAAWAADLADPSAVPDLFDRAEAALGPVEILINNADAWLGDTFLPEATDGFGRRLTPVTAETHEHCFHVNSRAAALLIAEFARRHVARGASWGRVVGLTSGGPFGFPEEVSYGAAKAAQENYTRAAATELAGYG